MTVNDLVQRAEALCAHHNRVCPRQLRSLAFYLSRDGVDPLMFWVLVKGPLEAGIPPEAAEAECRRRHRILVNARDAANRDLCPKIGGRH